MRDSDRQFKSRAVPFLAVAKSFLESSASLQDFGFPERRCESARLDSKSQGRRSSFLRDFYDRRTPSGRSYPFRHNGGTPIQFQGSSEFCGSEYSKEYRAGQTKRGHDQEILTKPAARIPEALLFRSPSAASSECLACCWPPLRSICVHGWRLSDNRTWLRMGPFLEAPTRQRTQRISSRSAIPTQ